ncbi:DUF2812 domain-containing protein [Pseudoflavonifractor phocaeensis]|uniref:DUF2812 domain-containing protein n=1 Tax=Pseudoflavonifractor phocaeensis TaxID=1870988 RepID=UPI0019577D7D|nr:DUF2812 domain-containing protein [Pseudoflavonifractor phocaeensis]MBM6884938.1 DUF2812 domain-containing protein [Pseudoflavonifractor phocaeensis]
MKDTVRKWMRLSPIDIDHFEGWLEAMAQKGLFFERPWALGIVFRRGEPASVRYRLDPAGNLWSRENRDYCRTLGWEYTGSLVQYFDLYVNFDPEAPELHTDPVVQSYALEQVAKRAKRTCILLTALTLVMLAALLLPFFLLSTPILTWLVESPASGNLPVILLDLLSTAMTVQAYRSFFRLRRRLEEGQPPCWDGSWRSAVHFQRVLTWIVLFLTVLYAAVLAVTTSRSWEGQLDGLSKPIPTLSLAELEDDPALEPLVDGRWTDGQDRNNYVSFACTLVAPAQYEIVQKLTDGRDYEPRLTTRWYRLSLPFLASPLLDELVYQHTQHYYSPDDYDVEELTLSGFDRVVLATDTHWPGQRLFLQKGNVVVYLSYSGNQDLTRRPELLEELISFHG